MLSRYWIIGIFFVCIATLIFLIIILSPEKQAVISFNPKALVLKPVTQLPPADTPVSKGGLRNPQTNTIDAQNMVNAAMQPDSTESILLPPDERHLSVDIVDALGDPISEGEIQINQGPVTSFKDGKTRLTYRRNEPCELAARADGYRCATQTVEGLQDHTKIVMEYYSCFSVRVLDSMGRNDIPVQDAEVVLWKGKNVIRPVQTSINMDFGYNDARPALLLRDNDGISVRRITRWEMDMATPPYPNSNGSSTINTGSLIAGMGGCTWRKNDRMTIFNQSDRDLEGKRYAKYLPLPKPNSSRLRIWDALAMCSGSMNVGQFRGKRDFLEFENSFGRVNTSIPLPGIPPGAAIVATKKTDANGMCQFDQLEPGFYYAQASLGEKKTFISPLHPTRAGAELFLQESSSLSIKIMHRGSPFWPNGISEAAIVLKKLGSDGIAQGRFMAKSNRRGEATIRSLPFGSYQLTAEPPSQYNLPPKTQEIVISDLSQEILIVYDAGVTLRGTVMDCASNTPVSGFLLELQENQGNEIYDRDISDDQGFFSFSNVTPGNYSISYVADGINRHTGFAGDAGSTTVPSLEAGAVNGLASAPSFSVKQEEISGIVYYVTRTVTTVIAGKVTSPEGTPIKNAFVFSYFDTMKTAGSDRTDTEGRFTFEYKMPKLQNSFYSPKLFAEIREQKPPYWKKSGKGYLLASNDKTVLSQGSVTLPAITGGETITDIHIIMESLPVRTITGKIHAPADVDFRSLKIDASQHESFIPGEIYADGTYKIDKVNPGTASIMCESPLIHLDAGDFGTVIDREYATEIVVVSVPKDEDILTKDIFLQRSGYLAGVVLDTKGAPAFGVRVRILNHPSGMPTDVMTQLNGTFWHGLLQADEAYTIEVYLPESEKPIAHFDGLTPSRQDITIKLNK